MSIRTLLIPDNWFGLEDRFQVAGLRSADTLFRHLLDWPRVHVMRLYAAAADVLQYARSGYTSRAHAIRAILFANATMALFR